MIKFLVLGVLLSGEATKYVYGHEENRVVHTETQVFSDNSPDKEPTPEKDSGGTFYNFHATHQFFFLQSPGAGIKPIDSLIQMQDVHNKLKAGYVVTKEIGAHKLYTEQKTWNAARKNCIEDGGHLAVIRSDTEENVVLELMQNHKLDSAWVGYHDQFQEGDWVSVLDEPLLQAPWAHWSNRWSPNPDNESGEQHCAHMMGGDVDGMAGMDDTSCNDFRAFICKIPIS